jgi:hypothetical protein
MCKKTTPLQPPRVGCCCIWLSGPGFQDLDKRALGFTLRTWVSRPRKLSILRSSYLFPVTFLCVHRHFSFSRHFPLRPVVTHGRTDATPATPKKRREDSKKTKNKHLPSLPRPCWPPPPRRSPPHAGPPRPFPPPVLTVLPAD